MKKTILFLLLLTFYVSAQSAQKYEITSSSMSQQAWFFRQLQATSVDGKTQVSGRLTSSRHRSLPKSHIDIAVYSASGELLTETTSRYRKSFLKQKHNRKGRLNFSVELKEAFPEGSVVKVALHSRSDSSPKKPIHNVNIAL